MDIARPSNLKQKRIKRAIYGGVALLVVGGVTFGLSQLQPAAPTVEAATLWPDTVKRGPDGPPGARARHAGAGGHPLDSGDDPGARRADHPEAGHDGEGERRHSRAEQPAARSGNAGRRAQAAVRRSLARQPPRAGAERPAEPAGVGRQHRRRLQQGEDAGRDERGAREGPARVGSGRPAVAGRRRAARHPQRDRAGAAGEPRRGEPARSSPCSSRASIRRAPCCS